MKSVFQEYAQVTTLHGPNHVAESNSKALKIFWGICTVIGVACATVQSYQVLSNYVTNENNYISNSESVDIKDISQSHYMVVCQKKWLNKTAITSKNIKYRHVLFALSLIDSLDTGVLSEMAKWNIPDEERIWGLPLSSCSITDTRATTTADVTTLLNQAALDAAKVDQMVTDVQDKICDSCVVNLNKMANWEQHSVDFQREIGSKYQSLTEFLGDITNQMLPMAAVGTQMGWRVARGQVCEVIQQDASQPMMSGGDQVSNATNIQVGIEVPIADGTLRGVFEDSRKAINEVAFSMSPFVLESVYDDTVDKSVTSNGMQRNMMHSLTPEKLLPVILEGRKMIISVRLSEITKTEREASCIANRGGNLRVHKGIAYTLCEKKCRKESEIGNPGYYTVTPNDVGDINIKDTKVIARRIRMNTMKQDAFSNCMAERGCNSAVYCEEWEIKSEATITELPITECPSATDPKTTNPLASISFHVSMHQGRMIHITKFVNFVDVLGLVGGIIGLYLGASLLTIVHLVVFMCSKICDKKKKQGEDSTVDSTTFTAN